MLVEFQGMPLWKHSFEVFRKFHMINEVGILCSEGNLEAIQSQADGALFVEVGGSTRTGSSRIAVEKAKDFDIVLIHDGARPFVDWSLIWRVIDGITDIGAAAASQAVTDTIRFKDGSQTTPDRSNLVAMQTPQGARVELLAKAYESLDGEVTDEIQALELAGIPFKLTFGSPNNIKITHPKDLPMNIETRVGFGYDIHPFSNDFERPMWLGGIQFEGEVGLEGHSDADVVLHAVVDAILGASGDGDIGQHFKNTDERWKNASSIMFLKHAADLVSKQNWRIVNVDVSVIAERPKIMGRADDMRRVIGEALKIGSSHVNVKATTNEGLGSLGRAEGIAAHAVATLSRMS